MSLRAHIPTARAVALVVNIFVSAFGAYTVMGGHALNPWEDFANAPRGTIGNWGTYIYYVAFSRGAISLLLICLATTTLLMMVSDRPHRAASGDSR
jgi:hypothetical protein